MEHDQRVCPRCGEPAGDRRFCEACRAQIAGTHATDLSSPATHALREVLRLEEALAAASKGISDRIAARATGTAVQVEPESRPAATPPLARSRQQSSDQRHRASRRGDPAGASGRAARGRSDREPQAPPPRRSLSPPPRRRRRSRSRLPSRSQSRSRLPSRSPRRSRHPRPRPAPLPASSPPPRCERDSGSSTCRRSSRARSPRSPRLRRPSPSRLSSPSRSSP